MVRGVRSSCRTDWLRSTSNAAAQMLRGVGWLLGASHTHTGLCMGGALEGAQKCQLEKRDSRVEDPEWALQPLPQHKEREKGE